MLRSIIFDFNGILVDDEPIHMRMFQKVLGEEGISLTEKDYYARYLGMDDRGCFKAAYRDHKKTIAGAFLSKLVERKAAYYQDAIQQHMVVFPGVKKLVPELAARYPLAIASGALQKEITMILESIGLNSYFQAIVSAEDTSEGKPSPEIFLKALSFLNQRSKSSQPILPSECLVIEDSKEGILGAHRAGIKCLAVANSHPAEELEEAEAVVESLEEVTIPFLESLLA